MNFKFSSNFSSQLKFNLQNSQTISFSEFLDIFTKHSPTALLNSFRSSSIGQLALILREYQSLRSFYSCTIRLALCSSSCCLWWSCCDSSTWPCCSCASSCLSPPIFLPQFCEFQASSLSRRSIFLANSMDSNSLREDRTVRSLLLIQASLIRLLRRSFSCWMAASVFCSRRKFSSFSLIRPFMCPSSLVSFPVSSSMARQRTRRFWHSLAILASSSSLMELPLACSCLSRSKAWVRFCNQAFFCATAALRVSFSRLQRSMAILTFCSVSILSFSQQSMSSFSLLSDLISCSFSSFSLLSDLTSCSFNWPTCELKLLFSSREWCSYSFRITSIFLSSSPISLLLRSPSSSSCLLSARLSTSSQFTFRVRALFSSRSQLISRLGFYPCQRFCCCSCQMRCCRSTFFWQAQSTPLLALMSSWISLSLLRLCQLSSFQYLLYFQSMRDSISWCLSFSLWYSSRTCSFSVSLGCKDLMYSRWWTLVLSWSTLRCSSSKWLWQAFSTSCSQPWKLSLISFRFQLYCSLILIRLSFSLSLDFDRALLASDSSFSFSNLSSEPFQLQSRARSDWWCCSFCWQALEISASSTSLTLRESLSSRTSLFRMSSFIWGEPFFPFSITFNKCWFSIFSSLTSAPRSLFLYLSYLCWSPSSISSVLVLFRLIISMISFSSLMVSSFDFSSFMQSNSIESDRFISWILLTCRESKSSGVDSATISILVFLILDPDCLPSCVVGYVSSVLQAIWGGCLDGVLIVKGFSLLSLDCWQEQDPYYRQTN